MQPATLRTWAKHGLIATKQFSENGKFKYYLPDVLELCKVTPATTTTNATTATTNCYPTLRDITNELAYGTSLTQQTSSSNVNMVFFSV